jgi:hypothetical protein
MAQLPRQDGASQSSAVASTAVFSAGTADKRFDALGLSTCKTSSMTAGSSVGVSGTSSSRRRSWNKAASCLHCAECPRFQSTSWHFLQQ